MRLSAFPLCGAGALLLVLAACSPALNWREVRADGVPVQVLMPCKPEQAVRDVPLLGQEATALGLHMLSCEAAGTTYALAAVRLPDGTPPTLHRAVQAWRAAAWASLKQVQGPGGEVPGGWLQAPTPASVPGSGLQMVQDWQGPGVAHNGQPLQARLGWAWQGPWLLQFAAYSPRGTVGSEDAWSTWTDSLRIQP
jgi:hypothetical protein